MSRLAPPRKPGHREPHRKRGAPAGTLALHLLLSLLILVPSTDAKAELLGDFFPDGVPGYGEARGVTVLSRLHPSYDPIGVNISGIGVQADIEESAGYDTNPLGVSNGRGSAVIRTSPHVSLGEDMDSWKLVAYAGLSDSRYLELPKDNRTDYWGALGAMIDVGDGRLTLGAAHLSLHQDPLTIDAIPADRPIGYTVDDIRGAYAIDFGRWTATPSLGFQAWRFQGTTLRGQPFPQAYRDRDVVQAGMELRYDLGPQRSAIMVVRGIDTHYVNGVPGQPTPDSQSGMALVGLDYDDNGIWHWRVLVGGEVREFSSPAYPSHAAPVAEADLIWNPSGMTTLSAMLARSIEDAAQEGVSGFVYTRGRLVVDHEYLRNVFLQARAALQIAQFLQGDAVQTIESAGVGITWLVNRNLRLSVDYDHSAQQGGPPTPGFTTGNYGRDTALVTVRLML